MATVYRAYDLRHDRKVAVKVLRPELAAVIGGDRFLAEIRTTANLQHPHILPLHDSGEADGKIFYVMPFVEGQSLRTRLQHERQLAVNEAVRITREVASALDYAHRHGVVHRDIKPENILLHDGQALVADFGIALAVSRSDGGTRMTETGMSLGTPHYMAPEQAMGEREISPRADVYALGCVLYECLAGEPPFTGPSAQAIIARVMTEQPRGLQLQRRTIPAHVEAAVRNALEKLPADRFPTAAAFSEALANPSYALASGALQDSPLVATSAARAAWVPRTWSLPTYVFAAAMLAFAAIAAWLATRTRGRPNAELPVVAFQLQDSVAGRTRPIVASTGSIAWARPEGVYVQAAGALAPTLLPGTQRPVVDVLAFSPDGEWLVFATLPETPGPEARIPVRRIAATGGVPQTLTSELVGPPGGFIHGAVWGDDGNIYLGAADWPRRVGSVLRVGATGGVLDTLLSVNLAFAAPTALLPGARTLLFTHFSPATEPRIMALDLRSRDTVRVLENAVSAQWSPTGHIMAGRHDGTIVALSFDAKKMRAHGPPIPVADSVVAEPARAFFSLSRNGMLAYVRGASNVSGLFNYRLALLDVNGGLEYVPLPATDHWDGSVSPDGRRVAYIRSDHVWLYDLDLGTHRRLTVSGSGHHNPVWSPDGKRVAFRADRRGREPGQIYARHADGDTAIAWIGGTRASNPSQWLPDNTILFHTEVPNVDVMRVSADGTSPAVPVLTADWTERTPRVSPDGKWLAYSSDEDGTLRLYIRSWPQLARKTIVSAEVHPSSFPVWSLDSRTLYGQEGSDLVAFSLAPDDGGLRVAGRRVIKQNMQGPIVAMHPEGKKILQFSQSTPADSSTAVPRRMVVVANWHEVLRERLGGSRPVEP